MTLSGNIVFAIAKVVARRIIRMCSVHFLNKFLEIRDEPRGVFFHFRSDLISAEADERVGGWTCLEVGGTIADHNQTLETTRIFQALNHAPLSTRF